METEQPEVIFAIGLPCSGKTTRYNKVYKDQNFVHISTDNHIEEYAKSLGKTYSEVFNDKKAFIFAEQRMKDLLEYALHNNLNIYWDQTNLTRKARHRKLTKIPDNYKKYAFVFYVTDEQFQERNNIRKADGKFIPQYVYDNMKKIMEKVREDEGFTGGANFNSNDDENGQRDVTLL